MPPGLTWSFFKYVVLAVRSLIVRFLLTSGWIFLAPSMGEMHSLALVGDVRSAQSTHPYRSGYICVGSGMIQSTSSDLSI